MVEELDSDETDVQGVGMVVSGNRRLVSDPLQFTGVELSRDGRQRRVYVRDHSDEEHGESTEEDTEESSEQDSDDDDSESARDLEDALVQSALARIRRAREKGRQDVKLSKEELRALERRRKRLEAEAKARERNASRGGRRKEQRIAVPLDQLEAPISRIRAAASRSDISLAGHPGRGSRGPPMGVFPPPNGSRSRPASSQRPPSTHSSPSTFEYSHVQAPQNLRHVSDSSARTSSRLPYPSDDEAEWRPPSSSRDYRDPFQYQTAGPRSPYVSGAAAARRNASGPVGPSPPAADGSGAESEESSEQEAEGGDGTGSEEQGAGGQGSRHSTPDEAAAIVVEEASPSPERRTRSKSKRTTRSSSVKRKPAATTRRRKKYA